MYWYLSASIFDRQPDSIKIIRQTITNRMIKGIL